MRVEAALIRAFTIISQKMRSGLATKARRLDM